MRIKQLKQRRADAIQKIKDIRDACAAADGGAGRLMTDEEKAQVKALEAEIGTLDEEIDTEQRALDREARADVNADPNQAAGAAATRSITVRDRVDDDPMAGFVNAAEFSLAVRAACRPAGAQLDERLRHIQRVASRLRSEAPDEGDVHREGTTEDGWMVPAAVSDKLFELAFGEESLLTDVDPEPTDSNAVEWIADESTPWGGTGVQAYWGGEAKKLNASKLETNKRLVRLQKLHAFVLASDELMSDSARLNARLTTKSGLAIRYRASEAIVAGDGAGKPLGWMKSPALVSIGAGSPVVPLATAHVLEMYARLLADPGGRILWLANRDTLPEIAQLKIGDTPIWTPPNAGLRDAPGGTILGYPVRWSEHAETIGTKGDLQLVNTAGYYAAMKRGVNGGVKFASSIHLYFDYDIEAFRWTFRFAGQPFLSKPVTPAKSQATRSHFVTIDTRA